jgi:hypothetical protein
MKDFFAEAADICVGFAAKLLLVASGLFGCQVRRPLFKAKMSPVQISKPIMSVESAEVEAAQVGRSMKIIKMGKMMKMVDAKIRGAV